MGGGDADCQCRFRVSTAALHGLGATGNSMSPPIAQIPGAGSLKQSQAIADLQLEVNRFGPSAPPGLQVVKKSLPITGVLDTTTATLAMLVVQKRANDALVQYASQGAGGSTAIGEMLRDVNSGFGNPVAWVSPRVVEVTQIVALYGDAKGLPKARQTFGGMLSDPKILALVGAAAVGLFLLGRR